MEKFSYDKSKELKVDARFVFLSSFTLFNFDSLHKLHKLHNFAPRRGVVLPSPFFFKRQLPYEASNFQLWTV